MTDKEINDVILKSGINVDTEEPPQDSVNNNNNLIIYTKKTSGVGDTPDLISDETPPLAILDIMSDSDLFVFEANVTNITTSTGERTEMGIIPATGVSDNSTPTNTISPENENPPYNDVGSSMEATETECATASCSPSLPPNSSLPPLTRLDDNEKTESPISSSHQTEMTTSTDNQLEEKFLLIAEQEQESETHKNSLTLLSTNIGAELSESTDGTYILGTEEQTNKHVIKTEDEVPSTINGKIGNGNTTHSPVESGAVSAPEVERLAGANCNDSGTSNRNESLTVDNITECINVEKSYDARESQAHQEQEQHQDSEKTDSILSENENPTDFVVPSVEAADVVPTNTSSRKESPEARNLSSAKKCSSRKSRKTSHSPNSRRKQSNSSTGISGKSPIRIVEVYERNTPVNFKSSRTGKPVSPYQCKIFPTGKTDGGVRSSSFVVNSKQHQILDRELSRCIEREKQLLVEALAEYYRNVEEARLKNMPSASYPGKANDDDDSIISNGSQRETYMSWIIKENESVEDTENNNGMAWNPLANIFRKSTFTQVSGRPSFTDKAEVTSNDCEVKVGKSGSNRIRLVGERGENDILDAGRGMYRSLKSVQKAIHLSDLLCFRNNIPELNLGESISQPGFQQFMESENEIEILANIIVLLGETKENVETYLATLQKANLLTKDQYGLTKIEVSNNNVDNAHKDGTDNEKKAQPEPEVIQEDQQTVLFTCPSCQSHMDLQITNLLPRNGNSREQILPKVHTILTEPGKIVLSSYYTMESKSLVQTALCDGHIYQTHFTAMDGTGPVTGITKAKQEYLGQPSFLSLEILLSTIHRCAGYIDVRIACSCLWARQSKRYLLELIEGYLAKEYKPATDLSRWKLYKMERKLKKINVFAGVIRNITEELVSAVSKLQFCVQKSRLLLNKNLKEPEMPGFNENSNSSSWDDIRAEFSLTGMYASPRGSCQGSTEMSMTSSVEQLFEKLKTVAQEQGSIPGGDDVPIHILMQIVALTVKDVEVASSLVERYIKILRLPGKKAKRVLQFLNTTVMQLGLAKDIQFAALVATFLSAVDKLSFFEELMCEQKTEIRVKIHQMCHKIIRKMCDLRTNLCMQLNWSINLAKNSYMRIKELNEIKRIRRMKKADKYLNVKMEFLRGSDGSLRASTC